MRLKLYQVDAFTNQLFGGNPAAVVPLETWLSDELLQSIASENNLSETAYTVPIEDGFELRWFTPAAEVRLCGHATLATAYVFFNELDFSQSTIRFHTKSGWLSVKREDHFLLMDFPVDRLEQANEQLESIRAALQTDRIVALYKGQDDYLAIAESQAVVEQLQPDFRAVAQLNSRGLIVSAEGVASDFVSRCFFPQYGIDEDPVTGSAHTTMTPYWAKRLQKQTLSARQLSKRTGELICTLEGDRVLLKGEARLYMKAEIFVG